ncbi:heat shock protein Hsp90 [Fragilariopsis cylindrus CCMP1102]|uniref:Heat shock protein Hsp90 n=1 Tax=Fragilariopsis cylindrus CCMP1102 TaxID=635003 RepID=A0A1E7ENP7_9STRA|nr:heat shock protein Hsp90 [Fragilariopsis cylindrus CCMP1102]|eukprot:OEU07592.1 heat shock protein Hsp90 [Fragilariopsis cylindrus CCMP1102]
MEFQAETKQLLDIVTHSLYTDKEVFLRELISNASDACEKLRHVQSATTTKFVDNDRPLEIQIELDEVASSLTIRDTGIGMTSEDIVSNLGTIARSGSKQFMKTVQEQQQANAAKGIIGKFGVGFYSAFMVADSVTVTSKTAIIDHENDNNNNVTMWTSDGTGTYELAEIDENSTATRYDIGTTVTLFLKEEYWGLLAEKKIKEVLQKYSNFVSFPIYVNGERVNTVEAVWARPPHEVERDTYVEFYKYIANAIDDPLEILHFRADAPLEVRSLLFIPSFHSEKYGMERMEPGVSLYSRKVLIEHKSPDILPDWLRFVKGVVDSEDLPLSISREKPQDSALIGKLRKALTRRFLSTLEKMAKKEPEKYVEEFYREYSHFLKEGICHDYEFQPTLAKLLRFETNKNTTRELVSLDTYVGNLRPEQDSIYYLTAPSREAAAMSPYLEAFDRANIEVIFVYTAIDDFVMANVGTYEGRPLVSVEKNKDDDKDEETDDKKDDKQEEMALSATEAIDVCMWMKKTLGDGKVVSCRPSSRLVSSPAIVTDNESGMMRRMMRMVDNSDGRDGMPLPGQNVEINPSHPIIVGLHEIKETEPVLARVLAEQIYDNCLVAAGLMDDSRTMLPRLNDLLVSLVKGARKQPKDESGDKESKDDSTRQ